MKVPMTRIRWVSLTVRMFIYWLKIIGLAPFSVGTTTARFNSRQASMTSFRFSKIGLVYNLLLSILLAAVSMFLLQHWLSQSIDQKVTVPLIVVLIRFVNATVSMCIITISWTFRQKIAVSTLNKLMEVQVEISQLKIPPSNKILIILSTIHLTVNTLVWPSFWITIDIPLQPYNLLDWCLKLMTLYDIYWFFAEYIIVVALIARSLENVNNNLWDLMESCSYESHSPFANDFLHVWNSDIESNQLATLRSLIKIRGKLSDISQDVDDFFSFGIVGCIGCSFFALVCEIYKYIIYFDISPDAILRVTMWIFMHLYPTVSLSAIITRTGNQAKLTTQIVRKLMSAATGRKFKAELEYISLQLIHKDFTFSGYDLFTLDFTMVHSILAATATYLVILLQF